MFSRAERQFLWISLRFFWLVLFKAEVSLSPIYHTHTHGRSSGNGSRLHCSGQHHCHFKNTHFLYCKQMSLYTKGWSHLWPELKASGGSFSLSYCPAGLHSTWGKKIGCTQVTSAKKLNKHISPASQLLFESDLISSSSFSGWVNWRAVGWTHVQPSCLQGSCYNFNGPLQNHWKKKNELKLSRTNIFFFKCLCLSLYISGYYLTFLCSCAFNHTYIPAYIHF